ncbi:MAG: hypothetical protein HZA50_16820 [Planctomycetes bacterium]|nr:hypothetical protein [Planctomycetota bacterium]
MSGSEKTAFALFFGNRGFFPASLQSSARREMKAALKAMGYKCIMLDEKATRHGAVETPAEGRVYARFLAENRGKYGGVILCLPNFGDETGAVAALKDAGVPILVQAYPDELNRMAMDQRRDAFCGKFSVMDVFTQYGVKFTALAPHTVHPSSKEFAGNVDYFDRLCRVVNGMREMTVGAIGARTTAFKTVRFDELALQKHGITTETFDLSMVFARVNAMDAKARAYKSKAAKLKGYSNWQGTPDAALDRIVRLGVVLDELIVENGLHALALRCWVELQQYMGCSPCVLLGELNDRGIAAACEVDVGNAITMRALGLASGGPAACLDWNNNYGGDPDKCILFHCGPVPSSMMTGRGQIHAHDIIGTVVDKECTYGCNVGRIAPTPFTFGSMLTEGGRIKTYLGKGKFTADKIPAEFFGCAGVAQIDSLQQAILKIGYAGHRHHVSVTPGHMIEPVCEAFGRYLGYDVMLV